MTECVNFFCGYESETFQIIEFELQRIQILCLLFLVLQIIICSGFTLIDFFVIGSEDSVTAGQVRRPDAANARQKTEGHGDQTGAPRSSIAAASKLNK